LLKSLKGKLFLARQFSARDWLAMAEAWWALLSFYLALHYVSLEHLADSKSPASEKADDSLDILDFAQRLQSLIGVASRLHLLPMTCLIRALTLHWMLDRRGIPSRLCIGANKMRERVNAHAWVEIQGRAIGEHETVNERFSVLKSAV
jgi:hypothetical protein